MGFLKFWRSRKIKEEEKKIAKDHGINLDKPSPVKVWEGDEVKSEVVRAMGGMGATVETPVMPKPVEAPIRVVRKRYKGFRLPPHTKCVNRGTHWGNPFKFARGSVYVHAGYRRKNTDPWVYLGEGTLDDVLGLYERMVTGDLTYTHRFSSDADVIYWEGQFSNMDVRKLKGWNLACFCKEDQKCHADILLRLANGSV